MGRWIYIGAVGGGAVGGGAVEWRIYIGAVDLHRGGGFTQGRWGGGFTQGRWAVGRWAVDLRSVVQHTHMAAHSR